MRRVVLIVVFSFLPALATHGEGQEWHSVATDGTTRISFTRRDTLITVDLDSVRIQRINPLFPRGESFAALDEVGIVRDIQISVGSNSVFVWRSAFADLVNPSRAVVSQAGRNYRLEISCRDGAEAYTVELYFDKTSINRRVLYSALTPRDASEDTRYKLKTVGQ